MSFDIYEELYVVMKSLYMLNVSNQKMQRNHYCMHVDCASAEYRVYIF